ncbi:MAG TPA: amidohydrolase [Lacipirellulaceae bacterium]|nr:amidohydrolase [Lacipirellulaceae bacterium]
MNSRSLATPQARSKPAWKNLSVLFTVLICLAAPAAAARAAEPPPAVWLPARIAALSQLYKELHQSPELSFAEIKTAARMAAELRRLDFQVTEQVGGHGVVGVLANGTGPTLMLRADMDGLPVLEETGLDYASRVTVADDRGAVVGVMHACGHDMHMACLVGTLDYLAAHRSGWQGTVVAIFQPAEEKGGGAQAMLEAGLLRKFPRPDFALALHVAADRAAGRVATRPGYAMANVDSVEITIHGRGGHGAYPHMTVDPIVIAARLVMDLQTIVSREVKPIEPAVVTVGSIHGGTKSNVIGDQCKLQLTVRSFTPEVRTQLLAAIKRKALAAAASSGAPEPTVVASQEGTPSLYNDPALVERVRPALVRAVGEDHVDVSDPSMGGEDFGRFGRAGVPIVMVSVGSVSAERLARYRAEGGEPSLHSPRYYPDVEATLTTGVSALASMAVELLPPAAAK